MTSLQHVTRRVLAAFRADDQRSDRLVALTYVGVALVLVAVGVDGGPGLWLAEAAPWWWYAVVLGAACVPILLKRRRPVLAVALGAVGVGAAMSLGAFIGPFIILWDLLYATQQHGSVAARRWVARAAGALVVAGAATMLATTGSIGDAVQVLLLAVAVLITPLWWGANVRQGHELAEAAREQAELERQRNADLVQLHQAERAAAVRSERTTMARDLHDVVASHLSAIAITSGAALAAPPDSARDRDALRRVRESSVASLGEMRSMIDLLRSDGPPRAAEPGSPDGAATVEFTATPRLADLDGLIGWAVGAGLDVRVEDADRVLARSASAQLSAAVDQAAHRIVHEALANALRHGGADVVVRFATAGDALSIEVRDDGAPVPGAQAAGPGNGTGLLSMRERAVSLGGRFWAGPHGDGWRVHAEIPMPSAVARAGA